MSKRASIFDDGTTELDISSFAPKVKTDEPAQSPPPEQVRAVTQSANFKSREPQAPKVQPPKRPPRRHRTGRNVSFSLKAEQDVIDDFYSISDTQKWVLGQTLRRALEALQRELMKSS